MFHNLTENHPLTLSFTDLSVWCYACEAYIDNPRLYLYKNLAHIDKFNEEIPWALASGAATTIDMLADDDEDLDEPVE
jgi:histone deacetylase 6